MTPRTRRVALGTAAAVAVLVSAITALIIAWPRGPTPLVPGSVPASWQEFRTSPGHKSHVEGHQIECHACHPSESDGFKNPGTAVCSTCHAKQAATLHRGGGGADATGCLTCHSFAPSPATPTCIGCHARPHGEFAAVVERAKTDCTKCHRIHETPSVQLADCTSCHDERATKHAEHEHSAGCADCHRGHAPAASAIATCASCHAQPSGSHPAGHDSCVGCHRPHDFAAGGQQACIGCHGEKPTLAAAHVAAHNDCTGCHTPHAPADAASSCVRCHTGLQLAHGKGGACISCHVPHADEPRPLALPCTNCHRQVAFVETAAHAGGIACEGCHKPHGFSNLDAKAICAGCHAPEISQTAATHGHGECRACHGDRLAHAPAAAPSCAACHAAEQATAPPGHAKCQTCHDAHAPLPAPACATCHQNKAAGPHQSVAGGCETCHRPHGPGGIAAPPACARCHARPTLPALHAATGHAQCSVCHVSSHEPPREDRATCTAGSCHADREGHQPSAQICTGCHVFRK